METINWDEEQLGSNFTRVLEKRLSDGSELRVEVIPLFGGMRVSYSVYIDGRKSIQTNDEDMALLEVRRIITEHIITVHDVDGWKISV